MNKILIGSIFVLTLILLMPSISAIQYNTINENIYEEQYRAYLKELFKDIKTDSWEYPIIDFVRLLFICVGAFRFLRGFYFLLKSTQNLFNPEEEFIITNPLVYLRGLWLYATGLGLIFLNEVIDDKMGWV